MQAARDLVTAATELAARMQHGQSHRQGRHILSRVHACGDATAIVFDPDATIVLESQDDPVAMTSHRLID